MGDFTKPYRDNIRQMLSGPDFGHLNMEERVVAMDYMNAWDKFAIASERHRMTWLKWHPLAVILFFWIWIPGSMISNRKVEALHADAERKQKRWNTTMASAATRRGKGTR